MNVNDVATRVRRSFGDESAVQVSDADIFRWINDAQREVVMHNEAVLQATSTVNIVDGTNNYNLPADILILRSIRAKSSGVDSFLLLKGYSLADFDRQVDGWDGTSLGEGTPYIYTVYDGTLFLYPTPQENVTSGLKILYSQIPTEVDNLLDELSLPIYYHNAIVKYCMREANVLDEDYEASEMHNGRFLSDVRLLSTFEQQGATEVYPVITVLAEDM